MRKNQINMNRGKLILILFFLLVFFLNIYFVWAELVIIDLKQLTTHPSDDWGTCWYPDGSRILLGSNRDGYWNIYSIMQIKKQK